LRAIVGGEVISLERSRLPAIDELADLPDRGLDGNSVTATLSRVGLHLDHGEQRLRGRPLDAEEATLLGRPAGTWFLHASRTSWTPDNRFAEHVDSLLDPRHFELSLTYNESSR
jgi:GntR family transcriptional regulator